MYICMNVYPLVGYAAIDQRKIFSETANTGVMSDGTRKESDFLWRTTGIRLAEGSVNC